MVLITITKSEKIIVKRCLEWYVLNVTAYTDKYVPRSRHTTLVILETEHPGNAKSRECHNHDLSVFYYITASL